MRRCWKSCLGQIFYCNPRLNRKLLCISSSFDEVCKILNAEICHKKTEKKTIVEEKNKKSTCISSNTVI